MKIQVHPTPKTVLCQPCCVASSGLSSYLIPPRDLLTPIPTLQPAQDLTHKSPNGCFQN